MILRTMICYTPSIEVLDYYNIKSVLQEMQREGDGYFLFNAHRADPCYYHADRSFLANRLLDMGIWRIWFTGAGCSPFTRCLVEMCILCDFNWQDKTPKNSLGRRMIRWQTDCLLRPAYPVPNLLEHKVEPQRPSG